VLNGEKAGDDYESAGKEQKRGVGLNAFGWESGCPRVGRRRGGPEQVKRIHVLNGGAKISTRHLLVRLDKTKR